MLPTFSLTGEIKDGGKVDINEFLLRKCHAVDFSVGLHGH